MIEDRYAAAFKESSAVVWGLRLCSVLFPPLRRLVDELQTAHCVRHRTVDELVLQAVEHGYRQVVVIGAGYDMRPARFGADLRDVRWIEVDHPATAERKAHCLERARIAEPRVERVSANLTATTLTDVLSHTSFDPDGDACFVLEGLVHYLSRDALGHLLDALVRGPGRRRVVLTFIRRDMASTAPGLFIALVKLLREIPREHFTTDELAALAAVYGLRRSRMWSFDEQMAAFAPNASGRPVRLSQDVAEFERGRAAHEVA